MKLPKMWQIQNWFLFSIKALQASPYWVVYI